MQKGTNGFLRPKKIIMKNLQQRTMRLLAIIIILGFGTTIFGMGYSQLYKGDFFKTKAETQQLSDTAITAQRGIIYDANMSVLAQSASAWKISLNATAFAEIPAKAQEQVYSVLINTLGVTREYLENKASYKQYNSVSIKTKVEKEAKDKLEAFVKGTFIDKNNNEQSFGSVVMIDEDVKRYYPYSTLASQILGFTGTDNNGLSGLESYYNSTLTGVDGRVISARSNSSVAQDIEYKSVYEAKQGTSLVLTVDETIQRYLENALSSCYETSKANSCTGIVMDVKTGAILAMSTKGDFDPNDPYTINDKRTIESINKITDTKEKEKAEEEAMYSQWRNRAISDTYEPGSVFKLITMAAGLEENVVKYDEKFTCTGSVNVADRIYSCHNTAGHGTQTLTEGLMNSCNPYFITIGQRLGVDTFYKYFEAFGFTEETGIDLPGEASPKAGVTYFKKDTMTKVNLASSSFGQSFQITPIQMITAVNAIANDGKLMQPYIVSKTLDSDGNVILQNQPIEKRQVVSESTSEKIMASMEQVALNGTARNAYVAGYRVGGKTGTSDKLNNVGQVVASFVGVAPTNDPRITVLIVVDEPEGATGGGAVAAPVAGEVIENTLTYLNVERQYNDSEKALLDVQVPSVTGDSVSEAKSSLEENKFSVQIVGEGDKVLSQMPASGQYIPQGGVIVLYTEKQKKKLKTVVPDFTGMTITEANYAAVNAGINIKVSGNSLSEESMTAYRQSSLKGSEVESGSTVTVYFRTTSGVSDH
ncbi:putative stage V sporulation protein D [Ruminococcus sp. CAG:563]|nr:putative stage V sporulation protein D [Ruminococcus sp. CAG:563]